MTASDQIDEFVWFLEIWFGFRAVRQVIQDWLEKLILSIQSPHIYVTFSINLKISLEKLMAEPKIKKTVSELFERDEPYKVNESHQAVNPTTSSIILNELKVKTKIPEFLKHTLKVSKQNQNPPKNGKKTSNIGQEMTRSKLSNFVHEKVKSLKNMVFCQICQSDFKKSSKPVYLCGCQHKSDFCQSCLHHYTIYKVKHFQEVMCPSEGCNVLIDTQGNFFKNLPIDIQRNYKKINRFYTAAKDPNIKMCPKQNCDGFLKTQEKKTTACNTCKSHFCPKCLLATHQGECQQRQLLFFKENLHYRQCKKCKIVIQKDQGCNHMTCRCRYQFCYVCGSDWTNDHYGPHDDKGNLIITKKSTNTNNTNTEDSEDCCQNFCNSCCGKIIETVCTGILKFFGLLFALMMILSVLLMRDIPCYIGITVMSVIAGLFFYSVQYISQQQCPLMVVFILFFPLSMAIGLKKAFVQIFWDSIPALFNDSCQMYGNMLDNLVNFDSRQ